MRLVYAGKYNGNEASLPRREHPENAVAFREPELRQFAVAANIGAAIVSVLFTVLVALRSDAALPRKAACAAVGYLLSLLSLFPHELLHGICFRETAYLFTNLSQGMLFVVGTEDMTRGRFVFMSLLPNLVFGVLPLTVGLAVPKLAVAGFLGAACLGMGFGDYFNVYNALTQMPADARTYLCGFHSYWYLPEKAGD